MDLRTLTCSTCQQIVSNDPSRPNHDLRADGQRKELAISGRKLARDHAPCSPPIPSTGNAPGNF
jgi:hypothetical protein